MPAAAGFAIGAPPPVLVPGWNPEGLAGPRPRLLVGACFGLGLLRCAEEVRRRLELAGVFEPAVDVEPAVRVEPVLEVVLEAELVEE